MQPTPPPVQPHPPSSIETTKPRELRPLSAALRVLLRVDEGAYATLALAGELAKLPESERGLTTELCYGTLRQVTRLDRALGAQASRGLGKLDGTTRWLLRLGAYQLLFMKTQAHYVVDAVVHAVKRLRGPGLAGLTNAILRKLASQGEPPLPPYPAQAASPAAWSEVLQVHHSAPAWLTEALLKMMIDPREADALLKSLGQPAPTWLRLNPLRGSGEPAERLKLLGQALAKELAVAPTPHPLLPEAVELHGGHPFTGEAYGKGLFTAQDLAAQLTTRLLFADTVDGKLQLPEGALLDGCAGVGGKTCHLAALVDNQRDIDAVDRLPRKLSLCRDHAHRLGARRIRTIEADLLDPSAKLRKGYAAVLLDAPCSGSGVLRRHPEARLRPPQLQELTALQRALLDRLAKKVLPGGVLLYSVCSLLPEEGPAQIAAFLDRHPEFVPLPPAPSDPLFYAEGTGGSPLCERVPPFALRTYPHRHNADGFYAVRLLRTCPARPTE